MNTKQYSDAKMCQKNTRGLNQVNVSQENKMLWNSLGPCSVLHNCFTNSALPLFQKPSKGMNKIRDQLCVCLNLCKVYVITLVIMFTELMNNVLHTFPAVTKSIRVLRDSHVFILLYSLHEKHVGDLSEEINGKKVNNKNLKRMLSCKSSHAQCNRRNITCMHALGRLPWE